MKYSELQIALSSPRIDKYKFAVGGNTNDAAILYRWNISLSQEFYGILGMFEVVLRNAIDKHYSEILGDTNWLITKCDDNTFGLTLKEKIRKEQAQLTRKGIYTHFRLVSTLSFGVWIELFTKPMYRNMGKTLLQIFPHKEHGIGQSLIYQELDLIRKFRNRIAHHEPICFSETTGLVSTEKAELVYGLIIKYLGFLGHSKQGILWGIATPDETLAKIKRRHP